jgi:hypothetical protein
MYVPKNLTILGSVTPLPGVDIALHTFLGITWDILLPYTLLGVGLMLYGQTRLMRGQREIKRQAKLDK